MLIPATSYTAINSLLDLLLSRMQAILGHKLIGLYVIGSLVTGDFDYNSSDIDLIAALATELDEEDLESLKITHHDIALQEQIWNDRIEVGYISLENLKKTQSHFRITLISPGEPFHVTEADAVWIINRYVLREKGITLFGPPPETLVDPISQEELMQAMQEIIKVWREWINNTELIHRREYQAFAILTMCRALYTFRQGKFVSKKLAALWAEKELPAWSSLIQRALIWRDEDVDHDATLPETLRFIHFVLDLCQNDPGFSKGKQL